MLKKISYLLTVSGLTVLMLAAEGNRENAGARDMSEYVDENGKPKHASNCEIQQKECEKSESCNQFVNDEAKAACNAKNAKGNTRKWVWRCYSGCLVNQTIGEINNNGGCYVTKCKKPDVDDS